MAFGDDRYTGTPRQAPSFHDRLNRAREVRQVNCRPLNPVDVARRTPQHYLVHEFIDQNHALHTHAQNI
jgi:hypothetical protein